MGYLTILALIGAALWWASRKYPQWFSNRTQVALVVLFVFALIAVVSGRANAIVAVFFGLLAMLSRLATTLLRYWPLLARLLGQAAADQTQGEQRRKPSPDNAMTRAQALQVLGLESGTLSREAILEAHRKLIARVHPDKGGSSYLAGQINRARDLLLEELDR